MQNSENALPGGGEAKPTQKSIKNYEITRRDRFLLVCVLVWCLLAVDAVLWALPHGMGLPVTVFGWYVLLVSALGADGLRHREAQVLLLINLALASSFALGSNPWFRGWNFLALLVLVPIHAWGLSGGAALPWWQPLMLWERFCLLLQGLFSASGASFAALTPQKGGLDHKRVLAAVLGTAGALALADEWLQKQDDAGLHYLRGNALVKAGRRTEAMNAYLHACRLDPDSPAVEALALWRGIMDFYCKDMYNP